MGLLKQNLHSYTVSELNSMQSPVKHIISLGLIKVFWFWNSAECKNLWTYPVSTEHLKFSAYGNPCFTKWKEKMYQNTLYTDPVCN